MEAGDLLMRYVAEHNRGVREGDFSGLVALLAPDAAMRFSGLAAGPFEGAVAIAAAFAARPPTDALVLLGPTRNNGHAAVAKYGWAGAPGVPAGAIRIGAQGGRIALIEVTASGGTPSR